MFSTLMQGSASLLKLII